MACGSVFGTGDSRRTQAHLAPEWLTLQFSQGYEQGHPASHRARRTARSHPGNGTPGIIARNKGKVFNARTDNERGTPEDATCSHDRNSAPHQAGRIPGRIMNISPLTPQSVQAGFVPPEARFPERVGAGPQTSVDRPVGNQEAGSREDVYVPSGLAGSEDRQSGSARDEIGLRPGDQGKSVEGVRTGGSKKAAEPAESPSQLQRGEGTAEQTPEEKARIAELKRRDTEVRRHEQAHVAAAGRYARGGASFQFVLGPDGKLYAVGGEVQIDTSEVPGDPEATIRKAQTVRRAALAPSNPSSQDQRVAAAATQMEFEARMELSQERTEQAEEDSEGGTEGAESDSPQSQPRLLNQFV